MEETKHTDRKMLITGTAEGMFKFSEENDTLIGYHVGIEKRKQGLFSRRTYNVYTFDTTTGLIKFTVGSASDRQFEQHLKQGDRYKVTFIGQKVTSKGHKMNNFSLELLLEAKEREV